MRSMIPTATETDVAIQTIVVFSEPGTFVLRAEANDGTSNLEVSP